MKNPYPRTHPSHQLRQRINDRIRVRMLSLRSDGSGIIFYKDETGAIVSAKEATAKELRVIEPGVDEVRPDVGVTKAVRKRRARS